MRAIANSVIGVALLLKGLAAAETGAWYGDETWRRTVDPRSHAFGPVQIQPGTLEEIVWVRKLVREEWIIDEVLALAARIRTLEPGEVYVPPLDQRAAYDAAATAWAEHLWHRAGGDYVHAAAMWRYGRGIANEKGGVEAAKRFLQAKDPAYLERFEGGL
jgi:hypothetical protein